MENRGILVRATVENLGDLWDVRRGRLADDAVRRVELDPALVDPRGERLIGNPEHGGEHVIEMY